jgi:hypothetical protein
MTHDLVSLILAIVCLLVWLWALGSITIKALEWWASRNRRTPAWLNLGILLHQVGGLTGRDAIRGDVWRAGCVIAGIDHADGDGGRDVALIILPADCHLTEGQHASIVWEEAPDA